VQQTAAGRSNNCVEELALLQNASISVSPATARRRIPQLHLFCSVKKSRPTVRSQNQRSAYGQERRKRKRNFKKLPAHFALWKLSRRRRRRKIGICPCCQGRGCQSRTDISETSGFDSAEMFRLGDSVAPEVPAAVQRNNRTSSRCVKNLAA